ncbi:puromycin-sensitive aminopeptidase [Selaginella moellendorffii]|uniref:puromycin-sensitive aminopeptidase n=1 Tax=Selaginella moellendorffii TaxID=88036 RepID=UPI000D1CFDB4|nr:puromycin-sensitive aminopeptidase [Selaginella moellendorffii]|eukprot:XP_024526379.1 puromycin-sensitive aminopeptidase [Selaginella moellendorffii]
MAVKEAPKESFLKYYKPTGYHFDTVSHRTNWMLISFCPPSIQVELKFVLFEKKTTVVFKIRVLPRNSSESPPLVLDGRDVKLLFVKINDEERELEEVAVTSRHLTLKSLPVQPFLRVLDVIRRSFQEKNGSNVIRRAFLTCYCLS